MNFGKYKVLAHLVLGILIVVFWHYFLNYLADDSLMFIGVLICSTITAGVVEFLQPLLKIGTNTAQGIVRTSIPAFVYVLYNLMKML